MTRTPLIAANWKMHGRRDWMDRPAQLAALTDGLSGVEMLICPPFPYIAEFTHDLGVAVGAQDCAEHPDDGAHTGEVSASMLVDVGADYVIVGHSERRAAGETSAQVLNKAEAAIAAGLTPIICVGESLDDREAGHAVKTVLAQLDESLPSQTADLVVAYEPVWAIGTGKVATPDDIAEMHSAIREVVGGEVRILYGGSVKPGNAQDVFGAANVDGALIGGAGLKMDSLAEIAKAAGERLV